MTTTTADTTTTVTTADTTAVTAVTGRATATTAGRDRRGHAAWVEVMKGVARGCPIPEAFWLSDSADLAVLSVVVPGHVREWAVFLGACAMGERSWICCADDGSRRRIIHVDARIDHSDGITVRVEYLAGEDVESDTDTDTDVFDRVIDLSLAGSGAGERS